MCIYVYLISIILYRTYFSPPVTLKGKENPWFLLMYCDKRISIRHTVD